MQIAGAVCGLVLCVDWCCATVQTGAVCGLVLCDCADWCCVWTGAVCGLVLCMAQEFALSGKCSVIDSLLPLHKSEHGLRLWGAVSDKTTPELRYHIRRPMQCRYETSNMISDIRVPISYFGYTYIRRHPISTSEVRYSIPDFGLGLG